MSDVAWVFADYDWGAVLRLLHENFAYMEARIDPPSSLHNLTAQHIADFACDEQLLVIEDQNGSPVACAFLTSKTNSIYVGKLAVAKQVRGRGYARQFFDYAEDCARSAGLAFLELETRIELTENHATFAKMGFVKTAETSHPGFDRPTSITMQKRL